MAVLLYAALQQDLRLGADDPQVALARATADRLDAGSPPSALVSNDQADLSRSLDPFVLVFDAGGRLLASSVTVQGQPPDYPAGVFDSARARGETRVTWQPAPGVRSATVAVPWRGGYVVAGRSLLLTEEHIDQIGVLIAAGWLGTLALIALAAVLAAAIGQPQSGACAAVWVKHVLHGDT
jgi:hypothetical protein